MRAPSARAERRVKAFFRWWWANRRWEFLRWLHSSNHMVPKPARRAYRAAGFSLSNWMV